MTNHPQRMRIKVVALMAVVSIVAVSCWEAKRDTDPALTAKDVFGGESVPASGKKFGTFSHSVDEHKEISCNECHSRSGTRLNYAGHSSCVDCHFREFVDAESQICAICHTASPEDPEELQAFPASFKEGFNMMFDHAQHSRGNARPAAGCAECHRPKGATRTIPAGISTHSQCFTCHTPQTRIGSCNTCHEMAPYRRVRPRKSDVLNYVFSHADHTSRQGVSCTECHKPKRNAPQGNQLTFPAAVQHFVRRTARGGVTCASCHNDRRAFGEKNFANCKRCHTRSGFTLLPN